MRRPTFDHKAAAAMYLSGATLKETARRFGVSSGAIQYALRNTEYVPRRGGISQCPWCKVGIEGTTPERPHICAEYRK